MRIDRIVPGMVLRQRRLRMAGAATLAPRPASIVRREIIPFPDRRPDL